MAPESLVKGVDPVGRSAAAWALARRQHGVLTRRDLRRLGFSEEAIKHRLRTGRLHRIRRGVYAVGRAELSPEGRWMAAVLTCGQGAALSHRSAAALWEIGRERAGWIHLSVARHSSLKRSGLRIHSRPALSASGLTEHRGIPTTTPVQTLIDLATDAAALTDNQLERAINEADKHDLVDPETLREALGRCPGPGVPRLRLLLDRHTFLLSDSDLEICFRPIAAAAGLPLPLSKQVLNGHEVDFFFPSLGLVVETDGWRYHRTPSQQTRAAKRDQDHTAAGLTPLRFSHWQIRYEPADVRQVLSRTAAHLGRGRPARSPAE